MENLIKTLPKPMLAFLSLAIVIILLFFTDPPHTVCDSQIEAIKENQKGKLFYTEVNKKKTPPAIIRAKERCRLGNSEGACYEYFMILRGITRDLGNTTGECVSQLFEDSEISTSLSDGLEVMVRLAWGSRPPQLGSDKLGWFQESDVLIFCNLKSVFLRAKGEEAWDGFQVKLFEKLPGEEASVDAENLDQSSGFKSALSVFSEAEVFSRSLFSVKCDAY